MNELGEKRRKLPGVSPAPGTCALRRVSLDDRSRTLFTLLNQGKTT